MRPLIAKGYLLMISLTKTIRVHFGLTPVDTAGLDYIGVTKGREGVKYKIFNDRTVFDHMNT